MPEEFKAHRKENGELVVKPIVEKDNKGNVKVKLPSLDKINEVMKKHGKRRIQQAESKPNEQKH